MTECLTNAIRGGFTPGRLLTGRFRDRCEDAIAAECCDSDTNRSSNVSATLARRQLSRSGSLGILFTAEQGGGPAVPRSAVQGLGQCGHHPFAPRTRSGTSWRCRRSPAVSATVTPGLQAMGAQASGFRSSEWFRFARATARDCGERSVPHGRRNGTVKPSPGRSSGKSVPPEGRPQFSAGPVRCRPGLVRLRKSCHRAAMGAVRNFNSEESRYVKH